jgi:subtilisin family serine protease
MKYLILKKRPDANDDPFVEMVAAGGGEDFRLPYEVSSEELEDRQVRDLRRDPTIEDVILSIPFTLIEPFAEEFNEPSDARVAWGVKAVGAMSSPQDGNGVTVAVLDTGIDKMHPAFSGLEFASDDLMDFTIDERGQAGSAPDVHGHGTHVAGTIFGRAVDGMRIGVAPGVKRALIAKVLGPHGGSTEAIHSAIDWAIRRRADVISMSLDINFPGLVDRLVKAERFPTDIAASRALEGYRQNIRLFDRLAALVKALDEIGRSPLIVAASGNESRRREDPRYTVATAPPAAAEGFVSVGAVSNANDLSFPFAVARFSNTGCALAAPGVAITSAKQGGGKATKSGTSMATPHVAGVIALWTQKLFPAGNRPSGWAGPSHRLSRSPSRARVRGVRETQEPAKGTGR